MTQSPVSSCYHAAVDRILRRQLDAIARDRASGASQLAQRTSSAVRSWLRRKRPDHEQLESLARRLLDVQSSMGPMLRIANEVALALDHRNATRRLDSALKNLQETLLLGRKRIPSILKSLLARRGCWLVYTYSYSSTVVEALRRSRAHIHNVWCSDGAPAYEGLTTARTLADSGIHVTLVTDAALPTSFVRGALDVVVLGADRVGEGGFVNKVGTSSLVLATSYLRTPVYVLADSTKLVPDRLAEWGDRQGVEIPNPLGRPHRNVSMVFDLFDTSPWKPTVRLITERGVLGPDQVRHALKIIRVSARLAELAK